MATAKPAAKTAAKPAAKSAPAKKIAAAPAPAPAPEEPAQEEGTVVEGSNVKFLGYDESVPADQQFLVAGDVYTVAGFTTPEGEDPGGDPYVMIDSPDFDPKKRESESNPRQIAVPVYDGEYELTDEVPAEPEPAPATTAPAATKAVGKTAAKPAAKSAPAKTTTKKTAAAPAPAPAPEEPDADELPELTDEDEEVLALVNGDQNLIQVAQALEAAAATSEYRLGGVLYHIKKGKSYLEIEGGAERYGVPGGFELFLQDYFNIEYRKSMYLIDIYVAFTQAKIENPAEAVAAMGWTKASKIARPMIGNPDGATDLIELANNNTVADLSTAIKEQVSVGGTREGGTKVTRTTLKFRLLENDGALVHQTLEAIAQAQGCKDIGDALVYLVNEYLQSQNPAGATTAPAQGAPVGKRPAAKTAPAAKRVAAK